MQTEAQNEALATGLEQQHDVGILQMEQAHEREMAESAAAQAMQQQANEPQPMDGGA
jgi:hypothetical protein